MDILSDHQQRLAYRFAHVPLPDDAIACHPWCEYGDDDARRYFLTREWRIGDIWVEVAGEQNHRGEVTRWVHVDGEDQLGPLGRVELIAAIVEAGQLYDTLLTPREVARNRSAR
ncbi:MAG: hypothetical protein ABWY93_32745 [Mycobacterium sp.]